LASGLYRHRWLQLTLQLGPAMVWLLVIYVGSLLAMLVNAFWTIDSFTSQIIRELSIENFRTLARVEIYRTVILRTMRVAALVTLIDALLAFPLAYYMVRVATPRTRSFMFMAVLMPLWASYLVRAYAWRLILAEDGALNWSLRKLGFSGSGIGFSETAMVIVFAYMWLPFMILPVYSALERIPGSLLEASADLGARAGTTFRRVILPMALPGVVAGSIFTFSLTLGDYIIPPLIGNSQFLGNVVYSNVGVANNLPLASAMAIIPIIIMGVYLLLARRLGAFDAL
jgi:putative spermidine/putrescine transport system permease protein